MLPCSCLSPNAKAVVLLIQLSRTLILLCDNCDVMLHRQRLLLRDYLRGSFHHLLAGLWKKTRIEVVFLD